MTIKRRQDFLTNLKEICLYAKNLVIDGCTDFLSWWGGIAYDYPYQCILGTLLITLICCIGFIPGIPQWIDGADALYSLPYSRARTEGGIHAAFFNETRNRPTFLVVTGLVPGENIFTWRHLEALQRLDQLIRGRTLDKKRRRIAIPRTPEYYPEGLNHRLNTPYQHFYMQSSTSTAYDSYKIPKENDVISISGDAQDSKKPQSAGHDKTGKQNQEILTFEDICDKDPFGDCSVSSVLELSVFDTRNLQPDIEPVLYVFNGVVYNLNKKVFPPHYLLGKAVEENCTVELPTAMLQMAANSSKLMKSSKPGFSKFNTTCIRKAEAFQLIYELMDREEFKFRNEAWEKVLLSVLEDNSVFGPLRVSMNAFRSRDDALRSSTSESSDVLFVGLTFGFIILYASSLNFSCNLYKSKSYPAISGVFAATLGMLAGMGFMSMYGIAFVPTALVCPFLIIGVGTDDMFVIINSYSMSYMVDSPRERCILSLRDTGLAITVTTLTSLLSFFIGLNTDYLSIKNFCYYCGAGMFFGYIFVLTFFFPIHCLDAKREFNRKICLFLPDKSKNHVSECKEKFSNSKMDICTFTLGCLMVRRVEHNAIKNYYYEEVGRKLCEVKDTELGYSDSDLCKTINSMENCETQTTQDSLEFDNQEVHDKPKNLKNKPRDSLNHKSRKNKDFLPPIKESNNRDHWFKDLKNKIRHLSNRLLTQIALEGHYNAIAHNLEKTPSNGILTSKISSVNCMDEQKRNISSKLNWSIIKNFAKQKEVPLHYRSMYTNELKTFVNEPAGTVGKHWRNFLMRFYGPILLAYPVKIAILISFLIFTLVSIYGCFNLEAGLELKELATPGSYLNIFDIKQAEYFGGYDFPVDIFFPNTTNWWEIGSHETLRTLHHELLNGGAAKMIANPLLYMLIDKDLKPFLESGNPEVFHKTLRSALMLDKGKYKQFEQNFVWEGDTLRAWRMQMLPAGMKKSSERAAWMLRIREICDKQEFKQYPLRVMAWNYMMTYYESDLAIYSNVTSNMIVAAITMLIIATLGMPEFFVALLVILVMVMIDVGIVGFMFFWNIRMNMVSMICLLIAVGFSVDFSAHVCHTFMETEGPSRDQRVLETLVLMGNPVFHGAVSSILGILMLGFSESYIFRVFFKMMCLVMVFALMHSVIFLPVVLSFVGTVNFHSKNSENMLTNDLRQDPENVLNMVDKSYQESETDKKQSLGMDSKQLCLSGEKKDNRQLSCLSYECSSIESYKLRESGCAFGNAVQYNKHYFENTPSSISYDDSLFLNCQTLQESNISLYSTLYKKEYGINKLGEFYSYAPSNKKTVEKSLRKSNLASNKEFSVKSQKPPFYEGKHMEKRIPTPGRIKRVVEAKHSSLYPLNSQCGKIYDYRLHRNQEGLLLKSIQTKSKLYHHSKHRPIKKPLRLLSFPKLQLSDTGSNRHGIGQISSKPENDVSVIQSNESFRGFNNAGENKILTNFSHRNQTHSSKYFIANSSCRIRESPASDDMECCK